MLTEQETSSLCFDLRETHIDRAKFDRAESLRRREKQNQASLVYYSIVSSPLLKGESKLCYFPKIYSNTNTSETLHLQDLTRTGAALDEQTVEFIVAVNQDKYKKESSRIL